MTTEASRTDPANAATAGDIAERVRSLAAWLSLLRHPDRFGLAALIAVMVALMSLGGGAAAGSTEGYRNGGSTAPYRAGDSERHDIASAPGTAVRGCRPPSAPRGDDGPAAFLPAAGDVVVTWSDAGRGTSWPASAPLLAATGRLSGCGPTGPPAA